MSPAIATDLERPPGPPASPPTPEWRCVLDVFVPGTAAPQGSKDARAIYRGSGANREFTGRVVVTERYGGGKKNKTKVWRAAVAAAVSDVWAQDPLSGPVKVTIDFVMYRPLSTPKRRVTPFAVKKPDGDKLQRAVWDALTAAKVYGDDSQVVAWGGGKRLAELGETPGARIRVEVPA